MLYELKALFISILIGNCLCTEVSDPKIYYNDDDGNDDVDYFDSTPCHETQGPQGQGPDQCDTQRVTFEVTLDQGQQWEYLELVRLEDEFVDELVVASATYRDGQVPEYFVDTDMSLSGEVTFEVDTSPQDPSIDLAVTLEIDVPVNFDFSGQLYAGRLYTLTEQPAEEDYVFQSETPILARKYQGCEGDDWGPIGSVDTDTCILTFSGGCQNEVYPLPKEAESNLMLRDEDDFVWAEGDFVTETEDIGQPGTFKGEGTFKVEKGTPKTYVVTMVLKGVGPYGNEDYAEEFKIEDLSENYGCPADVLDFCTNPQDDPPEGLPGLSPGVTPSSSLTCQQVGLHESIPITCHGEEVTGSHDNDITLHFKCPEGVNTYWSSGSGGLLRQEKVLTCPFEGYAWKEELITHGEWPTSCGHVSDEVGAEIDTPLPYSNYGLDQNEFVEVEFLDYGLDADQAIGISFRISEDRQYDFESVTVRHNNQEAATINKSPIVGDPVIEFLTEVVTDLDGSWSAELVTVDGSGGGGIIGGLNNDFDSGTPQAISVIRSCQDEDWGYEMLNEDTSCDLILTLSCTHSIFPQIDGENSIFRLMSVQEGALQEPIELSNTTVVSEESADGDGQFTLSVSAPIQYGVNNGAPKGLEVEIKLVALDGKIEPTVLVDTVPDDLFDYNGDPDGACPDVVSYCNGLLSAAPLLPSLDPSTQTLTDLSCNYEDTSSYVSGEQPEEDLQCRQEVKAKTNYDEVRVVFMCSGSCQLTWPVPDHLIEDFTGLTNKTITCISGDGYWSEVDDGTEGYWPECICEDDGGRSIESNISLMATIIGVIIMLEW